MTGQSGAPEDIFCFQCSTNQDKIRPFMFY